MGTSSTVIAALKYQGGVVIGADSQASDQVARVRWPVEKLDRVANCPCVIGFSGSVGMAQRVRSEVEQQQLRAATFDRRDRVRRALDGCFAPVYETISRTSHPPTRGVPQIALWSLAVYWAEEAPHILEYEINGDSSFHESFHAIGSASQTAYAVYRTLGGSRLTSVDQPKAILVMLRILSTCVGVEMSGVSEPLSAWVIGPDRASRVSPDEIEAQIQLIDAWEERERSLLLGLLET